MARGSSNLSLEPTSPIDAVFGAFDLGAYRIPYLSCVLTGTHCDDYLQLVSDDPQFTLANGRIEELFQREIDEERVSEMARFYINSETAKRPAFFNSITVALLPRDGLYPAPHQMPQDTNTVSKTFGPIRISWDQSDSEGRPRSGTFGCVYWNKLGVHAVAIDGQHRLAALKRLNKHPAKAKLLGVSILFLVLDPAFGLKAEVATPTELVRQLFIDLNKHAQKVSRARQLLLDDLDPIAIALRRIVGPELNFEQVGKSDGLPVGKNGEFEKCLPLELVDWHGEQKAKVDSGPYATSVLALEWALLNLCKSKKFARRLPGADSEMFDAVPANDGGDGDADVDEYARVRKFLAGWMSDVPDLEGEIDAAERSQIAFALSASARRQMGESIYEFWGRGLAHLLARAGPYRELADYRCRKKLLSANFGVWYQAFSAWKSSSPAARAVLKEKLDAISTGLRDSVGPTVPADYERHVERIEASIKCVAADGADPEPNLLFFLTGQRSLVLALRWFVDYGLDEASAARVADRFGWAAPMSRGEEVLVFSRVLALAVDHWNRIGSGYMFTKTQRCPTMVRFPKSFWQGSILRRESPDSVDFSGIAAERGSRVIYLLASAWMFRKTEPEAAGALRDAVRNWCDSANSTELSVLESSPAGRHLKRALVLCAGMDQFSSTGHDANKYPFAFLARLQVADEAPATANDHRELVKKRVRWIFEQAGEAET